MTVNVKLDVFQVTRYRLVVFARDVTRVTLD